MFEKSQELLQKVNDALREELAAKNVFTNHLPEKQPDQLKVVIYFAKSPILDVW